MTRVFLCAGDASGELHAAAFVEALRERRPEARFFGLGGSAMEKAGVELVVHQRELAIGGLVEVLRDFGRIAGSWRRLGRCLERERPDLAVLVDSPDFNLPFARRVRRAGHPALQVVVAVDEVVVVIDEVVFERSEIAGNDRGDHGENHGDPPCGCHPAAGTRSRPDGRFLLLTGHRCGPLRSVFFRVGPILFPRAGPDRLAAGHAPNVSR